MPLQMPRNKPELVTVRLRVSGLTVDGKPTKAGDKVPVLKNTADYLVGKNIGELVASPKAKKTTDAKVQ